MHFYPKTGLFPKLCNAIPFPLPRDCAFPRSPNHRTPTYCAFTSLNNRNSLHYWGIRYTTIITEKAPEYLLDLATCILSAAEVTSHPHLGGDDNATIFRTAETIH